MQVVYISGAYRNKSINGVYENIQKARTEAIKWWRKGYAVICPHMNTALMDGSCDDSIWIKGDLEILSRCDIIVMLKGWRDSEGACCEWDDAVASGIEIIYQEDL